MQMFDERNEEKKELHKRDDLEDFFVNEWEIWYVKLGVNVWFEQNGKNEYQRPVLVIQRIGTLFFVIPLSTKLKKNKYYYELQSVKFNKPSLAILSQWRVLDKRRFVNPIGKVSSSELLQIKKSLKDVYLKGI